MTYTDVGNTENVWNNFQWTHRGVGNIGNTTALPVRLPWTAEVPETQEQFPVKKKININVDLFLTIKG